MNRSPSVMSQAAEEMDMSSIIKAQMEQSEEALSKQLAYIADRLDSSDPGEFFVD